MLKIGHRGAAGDAPENTLASFESAIKSGVNAIELDIRRTKDNHMVVFHDEKLDRLTGKGGTVNDYTLKELKTFRINNSNESIPTLEEVLDFIDKKVDKILLEIKEENTEKEVVRIVKDKKLADRVIIISFHEDVLKNVKKIESKIETGLIYAVYKGKQYKNPIDAAVSIKASYILPLYHFTHTKNIEDAHKNNLKVIVWTIDTKKEAEEFKKKGVDGIASNYPEILKDL
ncbi:MAG: glycerophosphodiester phosphodiesterase [Candidatus Micrarchaeia archaeon]